jgi:4-amino-4-deoxy-L-arabinose transferase-like glycosyltransferase
MFDDRALMNSHPATAGIRDDRLMKAASLLLVLLLACWLRFYRLDGYGLWSDEFVTLMIVSKARWLELVQTCFKIPQPMPPLYFILERLFVDLLGTNETSLRLLSALSSTVTVYFVFAIGRILFDFEVGLFAALLCAVNSVQIVYAQNARPYALCLLLSTLSILSFLKWTKADTKLVRLSFVLSTTLLLYSHYIFLLVLVIQNAYFLWLRYAHPSGDGKAILARDWKSWLSLQLCVGVLLLPLMPQVWAIFRSRETLNWAASLVQYYPRYQAFFFFVNPRLIFLSLVCAVAISSLPSYLKRVRSQQKIAPYIEGKSQIHWVLSRLAGYLIPESGSGTHCGLASNSSCIEGRLLFLVLWYLVPLVLFFGLARLNLVHLFVERYLILASLASYLLLASIPLRLMPGLIGRVFVIVYLLIYVAAEPASYFFQKGQFSQGVPGGNEWRETLTQLANPDFNAPLFLFQSPFIESNQLDFVSKPGLLDYLAAPLASFYVRDARPFVLLPVHWWIDIEPHRRFKARIKEILVSRQEFTLLSTEEFRTYFNFWMERELSANYQLEELLHFRSSGALSLTRLRLSARHISY